MGVLFCNFAFNLCQLPFWNITVNPCIRSRVLCDQPFRYYGEGNSKCTLKSSGFGLFFSDHSLNGKHFFILINCSHSDWGLQVQSMDLTTSKFTPKSVLLSSPFKEFLINKFGELKSVRQSVTCITPSCSSSSRNCLISSLSRGRDSICFCYL